MLKERYHFQYFMSPVTYFSKKKCISEVLLTNMFRILKLNLVEMLLVETFLQGQNVKRLCLYPCFIKCHVIEAHERGTYECSSM